MDCQVAPEPKPSDRAARAALTVELEYRRGNHRFQTAPRTAPHECAPVASYRVCGLSSSGLNTPCVKPPPYPSALRRPSPCVRACA